MKRARPSSASRTALPDVQTAARAPAAVERAGATIVALAEEQSGSVAAVMASLPDPSALPPGTLVVVPGEIAAKSRSLARSVFAAFVRPKNVARVHRCSALVARGFVDVGGGLDESGADLAWGYAPAEIVE